MMLSNPMTLIQLFQERSNDIIAEVEAALARAHLKSYEAAGARRVHLRIDTLYEHTVRCVEERNLTPMRVYARNIARRRFESGYDLAEVQTAFNVMEEAIWSRILNELEPAQLGEALGLVSTVLGVGKDVVAQTYVSLASKSKAPSINAQSLFTGTDGL